MSQSENITYCHNNIFFNCYSKQGTSCFHMCREHTLLYIYSGKLLIEEGNRKIYVRKSECAFIRRNHCITMHKLPAGKEAFSSVFLNFRRSFLQEFYSTLDHKSIPIVNSYFTENVVRMAHIPSVESLYIGMEPYFEQSFIPCDEIMNIKLLTGVHTLLDYDKRFYPVLFDFTALWKIDILDFMNRNYMYNLTNAEIASFTSRSLSTFKRDFKKISNISPQKWIANKRFNNPI